MLKLFFNRSSLAVLLVNLLTAFEGLFLIYRTWRGEPGLGWASGFILFSWALLNFLNLYPWYPQKNGPQGRPEKLGIRLHFHKAMVPYVYLSAFALALKLGGISEWVLAGFALLFLPLHYVNVILLYFHARDGSTLTPGYFSHNFYRQDKDPPCIP